MLRRDTVVLETPSVTELFELVVTGCASFMIQIAFSPVALLWKKRSGFASCVKSAAPCSPQFASGDDGNENVPVCCVPSWNQI